jgi:hypothetical protein
MDTRSSSLPNIYIAIVGPYDQRLGIGGEADLINTASRIPDAADLCLGLKIPYSDRPVVRRAGNSPIIGSKSNGPDGAAMCIKHF